MKKLFILLFILAAWTVIPAEAQMSSVNLRKSNDVLQATPFRPSHEDGLKNGLPVLNAPTGWLQDSTYYSNWNITTTAWDLYEKNFLTYNVTGGLLQSLYLNFNQTFSYWINGYRYVYTYYPSGNYKNLTSQTWDSLYGTWMDVSYYHYKIEGYSDTSFSKSYDNINHRYNSGSQGINLYNASWQNVETRYQVLDTSNSSWVNQSRYMNTFDASNRTTEVIYQTWDTGLGDWVNNTNTDYSFDGTGYATGYLEYSWNTGSSAWVNLKRATYTNNGVGSPTVKLYETWDAGSSSWKNLEQEMYQYSAENRVTQYIDQQWEPIGLTWVNYSKQTYNYFSNGYPHETTGYTWNPLTLAFMDVSYNENDSLGYQLSFYSKSVDGTTYQYTGGYKYIYTYTSFHRTDNTLEQLMDPITFDWYDYSKRTDTYDADQNLTIELDQNYDSSTHSWTNTFKQEHFYSYTSGIVEKHGMTEYCYFANPLDAGRSIVCPNLKEGRNYVITLYNLQGQIVYNKSVHSDESVSFPHNLATGMYMMQLLEDGKMVASGKVIIR